MAPILMLTVGISGSGKSKFTNFIKASLGAQEVNADNIRAQLGDVSDQSKNKKVFEIVDSETNKFLAGGYNVIISNTNLHYFSMEDYCRKYPFNQVIALIMTDSLNPELCKERIHKDIESGIARSNVPDEVVDRQYENFKRFMEDVNTKPKLGNMQFYEINTDFSMTLMDLHK